MNEQDIADIKLRIAQGDEYALRALHSLFCDKLYQSAYMIVGSREVAEEIVSDVFMKLWRQRQEIAQVRDIASFLFIMTRNLSLDELRRSSGRRYFGIDDIQLPPLLVDATPEELMISAEIVRKINQAINELPPRCKMIFKLVKVDGLRHKEVAKLLNISLKTVEAQMAIALKRLHSAVSIYLPTFSKHR